MQTRPLRFALAASAALALAAPSPAGAQVTTPDTAVPDIPAPEQPDNGAADRCAPGASGGGDGNLSAQLSDCGGVLTPPGMADGDIERPAPDPDPETTPVIPPQAVPEQSPNGG